MVHDIKIAGATYPSVPAVHCVDASGNTVAYVDTSDATATASDVASGKMFYGADGAIATGTGSIGNDALKKICLTGTKTEITDTDTEGATSLYGFSQVTNISVSTVKTIPEYLFADNKKITSINMPNLEYIKQYAFCESGLSKVNAPKLKEIGNNSFYSSGLTEISAMPNLVRIGSWAFALDFNLKKIDIGSKCTSISSHAFSYCNSLTTMIVRATTPPKLNGGLFDSVPSGFKLYVPDVAVDTYKAATNWSAYASYIAALSTYPG
nr:MAG TPA: leucine rich repeat protein [Bacteriophage sp.]